MTEATPMPGGEIIKRMEMKMGMKMGMKMEEKYE